MPIRFAINGLGRVGRALLRIAHDRDGLELAAVNDIVPAAQLARRVARDTVHGPFSSRVEAVEGGLAIGERTIPVFQEPDPTAIDWSREGVEAVVDATGRFLRRTAAAGHLGGTVRWVVLSANSDLADPADATICQGVNDSSLDPERQAAGPRIISNSSCTTNCLALLAKVLHDRFGIRRALMSTVHSYTESQRLLDQPHPDPRRARAAALNIIPTGTTTPRTLGLVLPDLAGRIEGFAVRVPTPAVAMMDLAADLETAATAGEIRQAFRDAAAGPMAGYLGVADEELVSSDFIGDPRSAVVDLPLVMVAGGGLARVVAWYDNEWGYAHRLADLLERLDRHR